MGIIRRNPEIPYCWIPDRDDAVDQEKWSDDAKRRYFSLAGEVDYTLPPLIPGRPAFRVYFHPLSHGDFLRVQALEEQKKAACWEDEEIRDFILRACVIDMKGAFVEHVNADGSVSQSEEPHDRLFGADGKINDHGLSFFHNAYAATPAVAVMWGASHSRFTARPS